MTHHSATLRHTLLGAGLIVLGLQSALAGETLDAALGGAVGGAVGAAVGQELGGRDGAVVGAAAGAAIGAAVATDDQDDHRHPDRTIIVTDGPRHPHGDRFCPPGQAKKGRC